MWEGQGSGLSHSLFTGCLVALAASNLGYPAVPCWSLPGSSQGKNSQEKARALPACGPCEPPCHHRLEMGLSRGVGVEEVQTRGKLPSFRYLLPRSTPKCCSALSSLSLSLFPYPLFFKTGGGEKEEIVFDLSGGKKSVLFRLLANTTNSV